MAWAPITRAFVIPAFLLYNGKGNTASNAVIVLANNRLVLFVGSVLKSPRYQALISATHYEFPVNHAISEMKFEKQLHHIRSFSNLLLNELIAYYQDIPLPQAIVPIPLHSNRLRERGFNQSQLIAKHLTRKLDIPLLEHALIRIKDTPHQIGLKAVERRKNLKRAFTVKQELPKHIALIDDVVTTGSTIQEASKQCLKHGVERIDVWCLAKT